MADLASMMQIMPSPAMPPRNPKHHIALIAYDGMPLFEFSIAVEFFGLERPEMGLDWYSLTIAAIEPGPLRSTGGVRVSVDAGIDALSEADTLILPGWPTAKPVPPVLIDALRTAHARGARILTICSGVFALAATGLLNGRRATTHWRYLDDLKAAYPEIEVVPNVLYVDEGPLLISAGSAAGIDLCLYLVRRDFGPEAANRIAQRLIVPPHRDGGQAQYVPNAVPIVYERDRLGPLLDHMRQTLAEAHTVTSLARRAGMSERTFLRRFHAATGTTPAKWLMQVRLQSARDLLEVSTQSIDHVAEACGFGSPTNFRHHFREQLGTTPTAYRQTFQRLEMGQRLASSL